MRSALQKRPFVWLALTALFCVALPCRAADAGTGERALMQGHVDDAISILNSVVAARPNDSAAHLLLCRAYYSEDAADEAVKECEAALANGAANSSDAHDWMGRAYGIKADHAGPFGGISLAKRVREEFEHAVALDPRNSFAVNDLSDFYVNAPGLVGGGTDKATALADKVQASLPASAHRTRGIAAAKDKDDATAEREFKAATAVANKPEAWVDLAAFYTKRKRKDEAVAALRKVEQIDTAKDGSLVDVGSLFYELKLNYPEGIAAVRAFLGSGAKTDATPVCKARLVLGNLLKKSGDKAGARLEYEEALKIASKFEPARKALDSL